MPEGLEDEDPELQAALYASVMGEPLEMTGSSAPKLAPIKPISDDWDIDGAVSFFGSKGGSSARSAEASVDESIRRGREELARFQEEQQQALDMDDVDDDPIVASVLSHRDQAQSVESSTTERRPRRAAQDEEEEEMMRRAIEESQRMADEQAHQNEDEDEDQDEDMTFDDDEVHMHDEDEESHHLNRLLEARRKQDREREELDRIQRATSPPRASTNIQPQPAFETDSFEAEDILQDRIYDDEDAELQAALKASLEGMSADITIPPPPKAPTRAITRQDSTSSSTQKATGTNKPLPKEEEADEDEEEEDEDEETEEEEKEEPTAPKPLTAEELRRARLARFG
ncbi:hypothetical protein FRC17_007820 [Serendipita sp. 399]|nr:hypothetical protein FRC17_007820 [Serendipita sp. 399]